MSKRKKLDGIRMILRALLGEKSVTESRLAEEQQELVSRTMVAKDMYPSREEWEKLDFSFSDIKGDDVLYDATLPDGWNIEATDHSMWNIILDQNGRQRGTIFYNALFYDRSACMELECRYGIGSKDVDENCSTKEIYFGNDNEKLFVAGQVYIGRDLDDKEVIRVRNQMNELEAMAKQFGDEHYPEWESVQAYWDVEKTLVDEGKTKGFGKR